mgnify:CR=1 FL=1
MKNLIFEAVKEDLGKGDITTKLLVPKDLRAEAEIISKESGIISGLLVAKEVFSCIDKRVRFVPSKKDGAAVKKGDVVARIKGPARAVLSGERLALNFMQRLSGIAGAAKKYSDLVKGTKAKVLDTRKTTPLWRLLEKKAVRSGGCYNHRFGLFDAVLIKDNHLCVEPDIERAVKAAKKGGPIEIEVKNAKELDKAVIAGADRILLDNMNVKELKISVARARSLAKKLRRKITLEASGNVTLKNIRAVAKTGVDFISVGALTHSPKALDLSLRIVKCR